MYFSEKSKLRPRDSQILNLRLKFNLPQKIEAMSGLYNLVFFVVNFLSKSQTGSQTEEKAKQFVWIF